MYLEAGGGDGFEGGAAALDGGIGEGGLRCRGGGGRERGCGGDRLHRRWLSGGVRRWASRMTRSRGRRRGRVGAVGEGGIVSEDGADAGKDGVGGVAQTVDFGTGEWAGEPDRERWRHRVAGGGAR